MADNNSDSPASPFRETLAEHVTCIRCRYDLFGLPRMGTCPECHLPIVASLPPAALNDGTTLRDARPCITCGYNLVGLQLTGNCPECGTTVEQSLKGLLLRYASIDYLTALRRGARIAVWGMILAAIVSVVSVFLPVVVATSIGVGGHLYATVFTQVASLACSIIIAYGHFTLTTPDPGYTGIERPSSARQVARISSVAGIVFEVIGIVARILTNSTAGLGPQPWLDPFFLATTFARVGSFAAWATRFFAMMLYIRWLAHRIPDPTLMQQTRTYIWLLPVLTVLLACVIIGPLIAMILYCVMLSRVRWHVDRFITDRQLATN